MKVLFLTSALDTRYKDEKGIRHAKKFENYNSVIDNMKKYIKKYDNFVYVSSNENNFEMTDMYFEITKQSFNMTMPFKNYVVLDGRTKNKTREFIENADFIFLCGGHVPTQNKFFKSINLKEIIKNTNAVILGGSAGSMNCADIVYAQPELEGDALDPMYKRYIKGLGLTKISILPHYGDEDRKVLDGIDIEKDILLPDSKKYGFIAYPDESYILQIDDKVKLYGEGYLYLNGEKTKINKINKVLNLTKIIRMLEKFNKNLNTLSKDDKIKLKKIKEKL